MSRFLFDGKVFDAEYFKQKMAESRQRKRESLGMVAERSPVEWSAAIEPGAADLGSIPGLLAALDALTCGDKTELTVQPCDEFDLQRYEAHVQAHIDPIAITLDQIPPLGKDNPRDRIWRFIAVIFLMHAGLVDVQQDGQVIMVRTRETNREGPGVPGDSENADRVEGLVG